jgi:hypothetical protein
VAALPALSGMLAWLAAAVHGVLVILNLTRLIGAVLGLAAAVGWLGLGAGRRRAWPGVPPAGLRGSCGAAGCSRWCARAASSLTGRWAAVFPLGMYAAASHALAVVLALPALETVAWAFLWIALGAWLTTGVGVTGAWLARRSWPTSD